jgi:protease-4
MGRGKRATMFASLAVERRRARRDVQAMMQATYDVFVGRVAAGRGKTRAEIEPIAQGRVWTGTQAKQLGLVDELGGLDAALADARALGKVDAAAEVEVYPPELTLHDLVGRIGEVSIGALGGAATAAALADVATQLSPEVAAVVQATLARLARFEDEHVQAIALLPIVFR